MFTSTSITVSYVVISSIFQSSTSLLQSDMSSICTRTIFLVIIIWAAVVYDDKTTDLWLWGIGNAMRMCTTEQWDMGCVQYWNSLQTFRNSRVLKMWNFAKRLQTFDTERSHGVPKQQWYITHKIAIMKLDASVVALSYICCKVYVIVLFATPMV